MGVVSRLEWALSVTTNVAFTESSSKRSAPCGGYNKGSAKIINFSVIGGGKCHRLSLNTEEFTWTIGVVEESEFPSATGSGGSYRDQG